MKFMTVLTLCLLVSAAFGCNKKAVQKKDAKPQDIAQITLDRNRQQTTIETSEGRVVTREGEQGGGEVVLKDEQGGVTHRFEAAGKNGSVTVTDGKGGVSTYGTGVDVTAADLDIPFYPGGEITFGIKSRDREAGGVTRAALTTADSYEKPLGFYTKATPGSAYHHTPQLESGRMDMWSWHDGAFQYNVIVKQETPGGAVSITLEKMGMQ